MYKLIKDLLGNTNQVLRIAENACIPFDPANIDYANFKKEILDGAELIDADGNAMDAIQFVNTLP